MVSIFFGVAVVAGTVVAGAVAAVLPSGDNVVVAAWLESSPPPPHATTNSAMAVSRTTIRRAHERSGPFRNRRRARRRDKPATLRGAHHRTRAPLTACRGRVVQSSVVS